MEAFLPTLWTGGFAGDRLPGEKNHTPCDNMCQFGEDHAASGVNSAKRRGCPLEDLR